ncbi:carbon-nitrogen hydrolase family protein [Mycolicibacterium austroafricanum]|uniref:carbon-nitrogen hydrolase family protein n=1 Tax=Mycolicibacterium austroafricanum TaxID=39687 RepID=UPI001CA321F2|nr:carbon-nitrogen hydrolase family protein [Mycolicibacterium austroafricanum]QZT64814.1 carbon-nitrogen hydrolase family protein [Mycolicibacterium austroafricanum]
MVLAAAVQLEAVLGDVSANLAACERLADEAGCAGARIIALPEFFSTGIGFVDALKDAALPPDGEATALLTTLARRHRALVGGSFLCRDADGHVRNAYLAVGPDGAVGRHDKDLPTMWENAFYTGGHDDGVFTADGYQVGAAVCWELMRTRTAARLRSRVDLLMTGSGWWSIPRWRPHSVFDRWERRNSMTARAVAPMFAQYVGAPILHAAHSGGLACSMPWLPITYRGHFEGATLIADARGEIVAERHADEGAGVVLADIEIGRQTPLLDVPQRYWLHQRGLLPTAAWHYQRWHGRRWYRRHVVRA